MKSSLASVLLLLISIAILSASEPVRFSKLSEALSFLDKSIDQKRWKSLEDALYPPFKEGQPNRNYWSRLESARGTRQLKKMFSDMEFPEDETSFSIGYCRAGPLPHTHIDFIKVDAHWRLTAVWMCR